MDITKFTERLGRSRDRFSALNKCDGGGPNLEELQNVFEELNVAEEELREQNDQLLEAQRALEQERLRYCDLFETAPDGFVVTDMLGTVRQANKAALELLRAPERAVVGKPLIVFIAAEERRAFRTLLARLPQLRRIADWEVLMQPRQAAPWPASISVAMVGDGTTPQLRWLLRDVSERRRQHDELRAWSDDLERRVRARTDELERQGAELADALRRERELRLRAEEADRAKEAFLATVSHELRTPLTALLGWVYLLTRGKTDAAGLTRAYEAIERSTHAQIKLVDDILDASRMMAGKLKLEKNDVDLAEVVSSAVATLRPSAAHKSLALECHPCEGPVPVVADPDRVQQVVWNLLANAIKFTPPGGSVRVLLERGDGEARVSVIDTGAGIEPEFIPHVFERFRQGDTSTTRDHGGLGLGLAIARHIVEAHGGVLMATSEGRGRGATFRFILPLAAEPVEAAAPARIGLDRVAPDGPIRVLLVDDDRDTREMLVAALQILGFEPVAADGADGAVAQLGQEAVDVIVTDIGMPGKDGYALLRAVRALPPPSAGPLPVVALTGYSGADSRSQMLDAGFCEVLMKPVVPSELDRMLRDVVRGRRAEAD
jgi:PAS domain S-box-containing protein